MPEDLNKFIERATDVLAEFAQKEKAGLPKPDEAARVLLESEKNIPSIESKFNANRLEIIYSYLKFKYPEAVSSENAEKLIRILRALSGKEDASSVSKMNLAYHQLLLELKKIEDGLTERFPGYQKKLL